MGDPRHDLVYFDLVGLMTYQPLMGHLTSEFVSFVRYRRHLMGRVFANDPGDLDSISGHVIPKTLKMVLDAAFA